MPSKAEQSSIIIITLLALLVVAYLALRALSGSPVLTVESYMFLCGALVIGATVLLIVESHHAHKKLLSKNKYGELKEFFKKAAMKGFKAPEIRKILVDGGWGETLVDRLFNDPDVMDQLPTPITTEMDTDKGKVDVEY